MKCYTIKLDRNYISSLSNECYTADEVAFYLTNKGFHFSNKCGVNKITLSSKYSDALIIIGVRNLHSWIDKLHTRVDSGLMSFKKMVIEEVEK